MRNFIPLDAASKMRGAAQERVRTSIEDKAIREILKFSGINRSDFVEELPKGEKPSLFSFCNIYQFPALLSVEALPLHVNITMRHLLKGKPIDPLYKAFCQARKSWYENVDYKGMPVGLIFKVADLDVGLLIVHNLMIHAPVEGFRGIIGWKKDRKGIVDILYLESFSSFFQSVLQASLWSNE